MIDKIIGIIYNAKFLNYLGGIIIVLALILLVFIFIELRMKKTVKIRLNEKGIRYLKSIDEIMKSGKTSQKVKELNSLVKDFLKGYLKLNFTPTYGEAMEMIKGKNNMEDLRQICDELSILVYAGESATEEKVNKIAEMFENIVKYRLIKLDEEKVKEIEKIISTSQEELIDERKIRMVMSTLKEAKKSLVEGDLQEAHKSYEVAATIYETMNEKEKRICNEKIIDVYNEIVRRAGISPEEGDSKSESKSESPE